MMTIYRVYRMKPKKITLDDLALTTHLGHVLGVLTKKAGFKSGLRALLKKTGMDKSDIELVMSYSQKVAEVWEK